MRKLTLTCTEQEKITLEQLATQHPKEYFRIRGKALITFINGELIPDIARVLDCNPNSIREWVHLWNKLGLTGILKSRKGGAPAKLTECLIKIAVEIAMKEPMSLAQIAAYVHEVRPDAPKFSLDRLGVRLREKGLSYKRTRHSLKKKKSG